MEITIRDKNLDYSGRLISYTEITTVNDTMTWPDILGEVFTMLKGLGYISDLGAEDIVSAIEQAKWDKEHPGNDANPKAT